LQFVAGCRKVSYFTEEVFLQHLTTAEFGILLQYMIINNLFPWGWCGPRYASGSYGVVKRPYYLWLAYLCGLITFYVRIVTAAGHKSSLPYFSISVRRWFIHYTIYSHRAALQQRNIIICMLRRCELWPTMVGWWLRLEAKPLIWCFVDLMALEDIIVHVQGCRVYVFRINVLFRAIKKIDTCAPVKTLAEYI